MNVSPSSEGCLRRLRRVHIIALADLVELVALAGASVSGQHAFVQVSGPVHGGIVLILVVTAATAAINLAL